MVGEKAQVWRSQGGTMGEGKRQHSRVKTFLGKDYLCVSTEQGH